MQTDQKRHQSSRAVKGSGRVRDVMVRVTSEDAARLDELAARLRLSGRGAVVGRLLSQDKQL